MIRSSMSTVGRVWRSGRGDLKLYLLSVFSLAVAFVIHKEEQALFPNWSAKRTAEIITQQLGRFVGLTALQFGQLDEVIVGTSNCVSVRLEK